MAKYYYIDECVREGDNPVQEYANEIEFWEGLKWNWQIAKEYGDRVDKWSEIRKGFEENDDYEYGSLNGATFLKLTNKTLKEFGY